MSDPGLGKPVDALDTVCKAYKDCQKCARKTHGDTCIGEFTRYKFQIRRNNVICKDDENSCERDLCECDALFAKEHFLAKDSYVDNYHMFFSDKNPDMATWNPTSSCMKSPPGNAEPTCCGGGDAPFVLINSKRKECCADGSTANIGMC